MTAISPLALIFDTVPAGIKQGSSAACRYPALMDMALQG